MKKSRLLEQLEEIWLVDKNLSALAALSILSLDRFPFPCGVFIENNW
jgi:hypothetical protein